MHKILRFVFSKRFIACVLAVLQLILFIFLITQFYKIGPTIYFIATLFSVMIMMYLFERDNLNPSYKLVWLIIMVILPITGAVFYFLWGDTGMSKKQKTGLEEIKYSAFMHKKENDYLIDEIADIDKGLAKQAKYLNTIANATPYTNTSNRYYAFGEDFLVDFLEDLRNAKKTIFMQYFIVEEGYMWQQILDVLVEKAKEGVDVRVIYDGFGCLLTLPEDYEKKLTASGVKTYVFNPVKFSLHLSDYLMLNHRDHRKLSVIDSTIGYSGGLNMADEYINKISPHGVWKDTAFRIEGDAVYSLTTTFLQTWQLVSKEYAINYDDYLPEYGCETDGIVQPYFDTPLDRNNICENTYLNVINNAKEYVYIATPYLIIDNEIITALNLAAQSGIDVRIFVPGIPDKWYAYYMTQSYYKVLMQAGVKIYEYTPGFLHAKMYISDDLQAIVGSANMDYRSLYLHFENCCNFYGGTMVKKVKDDFEEMLKVSHLLTLEEVSNIPFFKRIYQIVFKVFSPLM